MGDVPGHDNHHNNNNTEPHHHHNALRIQTENLAPRDSSPPPPSRIASQRSFTSLNGSYTSSPIITPSGSTHLLPSSALTPLPSPLVAFNNANALPGSLSLDSLRLENSPRRKPYGGLGSAGIAYADGRRNVTEFPASQLSENYLERTISGRSLSGRVLGEEGLRREPQRSRTSSVSEDIFDLDYWRDENDKWIYAPTRYVKLKSLGRGTFSKVLLAEPLDLSNPNSFTLPSYMAIKLVRLDAISDAPADRIQSSAKRELDILKRINHPCITRLLAYKEEGDKCLFGLGFSPGGDLFEFATRNKTLLTPGLVKRVFKEIVLAVKYLHDEMHVVHRDLKLENVLLNYPASELEHPESCLPPLTCLTDLGLSRPYDPANPLLSTRCGSTDYAAPEIMLGQPYDGRATDAWALGVILYCLLESRLPFDPPPDARRPGKVAHRIAMGQWKWYRLARERRTALEEDTFMAGMGTKGLGGLGEVTVHEGGVVQKVEGGEGAFIRGGGVWEGGMEIVEGLLRRKGDSRWSVDDILKASWLNEL